MIKRFEMVMTAGPDLEKVEPEKFNLMVTCGGNNEKAKFICTGQQALDLYYHIVRATASFIHENSEKVYEDFKDMIEKISDEERNKPIDFNLLNHQVHNIPKMRGEE